MYQALYRKWRPKTFDDVVGQDHITTTLRNEISAGRPAHAYLLMGSRGTGKTTCAKLIAKAVNCLDLVDGSPCGKCSICTGIDTGSMVDVMEIDAASNNGVDNIRELREEANFLPNIAKYRVYIIDEVHMLSIGAVNALLKIMEEPPAHVMFVLATTEVHKVPATIQSRCQRFDFKRINSDTIAKRLAYIADQEDFSATEEALTLIGKLADGGMRDALSLLDLCSSHNREITVETVSEASGLVGQEYLFQLSDAITTNNYTTVLEIVDSLGTLSVEYDRLCQQLVSHYRNLLIAATVKNPDKLIICLPEVLERYIDQCNKTTVTRILYVISVLQEVITNMIRSQSRRIDMEICLAKLCDARLSTSTESLLLRIEELEAKFNAVQAGIALAPSPIDTPTTGHTVPASSSSNTTAVLSPSPPVSANTNMRTPQQPVSNDQEELMPQWADVIARLGKSNPALRGALLDSQGYTCGTRILIQCSNDVFREMMRTNEYTRSSLKQAIAEVTGKKYSIGPRENKEESKVPILEKTRMEALIEQAKDSGIPVEIGSI